MIPRFRSELNLKGALLGLFSNENLSLEEFEAEAARIYGFRHAVYFSYGRQAIRCYLETLSKSLNLPTNRGAVLSTFNCVALGNAVVQAGFKPRYVDTGADFQADRNQFIEAMNESPVSVGIHVSPWGDTADSDVLRSLKKPILHDRCLAALDQNPFELGSERDAAVYSFGWGKPLGYLHGGMLCGNSKSDAAEWKKLQAAYLIKSSSRLTNFKDSLFISAGLHPTLFPLTLKLQESSFLSRLTGRDAEWDASEPSDACERPDPAVLTHILDKMKRAHSYRTERADQITTYFSGLEKLDTIKLPPRCTTLSHFPIRIEERGPLKTYLQSQGFFSSDQLFSKLLHQYSHLSGGRTVSFNRAETLARTTLHLPLYFGLRRSAIETITEKIRSFYGANR